MKKAALKKIKTQLNLDPSMVKTGVTEKEKKEAKEQIRLLEEI